MRAAGRRAGGGSAGVAGVAGGRPVQAQGERAGPDVTVTVPKATRGGVGAERVAGAGVAGRDRVGAGIWSGSGIRGGERRRAGDRDSRGSGEGERMNQKLARMRLSI